MSAKIATLTAKQTELIEAIASGATMETAALKAGVSIRVAYRWKSENEAFKTALREIEQYRLSAVAQELAIAGVQAVRVLLEIAQDEKNIYTASVRTNAAGKLLEALPKYREIVSIEDRLAALEERLNP